MRASGAWWLVPTPDDWLYAAELPVALVVALLVLRTDGGSRTRWPLVLFLVLYAGSSLDRVVYLAGLDGDRTIAYDVAVATHASILASFAAYLLLIGAAVDSPLARPLGTPVARWVLVILCFVPLVGFWARPGLAIAGRGTLEGDHWRWLDDARAYTQAYDIVTLAIPTFGILASLHALKRAAPATIARQRAAWYSVAFGLQDVAYVLGTSADVMRVQSDAVGYLTHLFWLAFPALLPYAMLRYQLFDIDLKLKLTLRRGTVAAVFLAVFFVVAQVIQNVATEALGYLVGAVAAGLLLFALQPLQSAAQRFADAAMPQVRETSAYASFRKLEVYKAAVEVAAEGGISGKDRRTLDALRAKLGIDGADASAIEADVMTTAPA